MTSMPQSVAERRAPMVTRSIHQTEREPESKRVREKSVSRRFLLSTHRTPPPRPTSGSGWRRIEQQPRRRRLKERSPRVDRNLERQAY